MIFENNFGFLCFVLCTLIEGQSSFAIASPTKPTPTEEFGNVWQLDTQGNYWLFWKSNNTHITFETHVKTKGYVGFGLSSNGKMFPSDVVVGWVDTNGQNHFKDCHTEGHTIPVVDTSQDYYLLYGLENQNGTVLKFERKLDTCDEKDYLITDSTIKVIWSYHPEDPESFISLTWHGADRCGAKSLMLLSSGKGNDYVPPSDAYTFDLVHHNFHVPAKDTTYQCKLFKVPNFTRKHHMIRYEPIITPGNENHVHHILVYNCPSATDNDDGTLYECYENTPKQLRRCIDSIIAWAVGGVAFNFPSNAGFSFGANGDPQYLLMEIHYNNPTYKSGIVDSSGIRILVTHTLRDNDAGLLEIGQVTNELQIIPPFENAFIYKAMCNRECIQKALKSQSQSMKVFGVLLHAHLIGAAIKARHIRGNVELEPLAEDKNYDFDYQDFRSFEKEKEIKFGDSLILECTYDSTGRTKPTLGGLSTSFEMCIGYIYYYPRTPIYKCISEPMYSQISSDPMTAANQMYSWNWQDANVRERYRQILENSTYYHFCNGYTEPFNPSFQDNVFSIREPRTKYIQTPRHCPAN